MIIKVYNDESLVFVGEAAKMIEDNEGNEDVIDMIEEAGQFGECEKNFYSGTWRIERFDGEEYDCAL